MNNDYIIRDSVVSDIPAIGDITHITWLATYPNQEEGITVADVESVYTIDQNSAEYITKQERRIARYSNPNFHIWVAENNGKIIGFCSAVKEETSNRIMAIYVLPSYQGIGIGKALINKAFEWLGNEKEILVNVARYNGNAIQFYERMGFIKTDKKGVFDDIARLPTGKVIPEIQMVRKNS